MITDTRMAAARSFVRSLNIVLKLVRLYGFEHSRSAEQFTAAWNELHAAMPVGDQTGLLLGAAGSQILLDGAPLEASSAERSFAQLLSAAGLASIHFLPGVTKQELALFVQAFPTSNAKPSVVADQLRNALAHAKGIRINEVRFVAEDSTSAEVRVAASLMAKTLGSDASHVKAWLNDPQKLLQLIAAAEGARAGSSENSGVTSHEAEWHRASGLQESPASASAGGPVFGDGAASSASGTRDADILGMRDDEILKVLRLLSQLGQAAGDKEGSFSGPGPLGQEFSKISGRSRDLLRQSLVTLAAQAPGVQADHPMLLRLAEHLAIRFALDRYEHGEVRVNAVREMIDRMSQEIVALRQILGAHEEKMAQAGMIVESEADLMDRQFWAAVPESGKRSVLTSPDAWCIPARNVRQYVEELIRKADRTTAIAILQNYAGAIKSEDASARRRAAIGLGELADLYLLDDAQTLIPAIRSTGLQLGLERETELQGLVTAAFVRLAQEAAKQNRYRAVLQSMDLLDGLENQRPAFAQTVRPRLGLEKRLPDFIEEAIRTQPAPDALIELIQRVPRPAIEHLVSRFNRSGSRSDSEGVVQLTRALGAEGMGVLKDVLLTSQPAEAAEAMGLLSRLDPEATEKWLGSSLRDWSRTSQDRALRRIAGSGATQRGWLILSLFDQFDPILQPLATEEIGMAGEILAAEQLMRLASGELPQGSSPYLRLKAIEALGRLQLAQAADLLREILVKKKFWRWMYHNELRIAAFHAMRKIDPGWAAEFLPHSGFSTEDLELAPRDPTTNAPWFRQRRNLRITPSPAVPASASSGRETVSLQVHALSLSGGLASAEKYMIPGTLVSLRLGSALRPIHAQAFVRSARPQILSFEFADTELDEHARLRRLLHENGAIDVARKTLEEQNSAVPVS
jgi:hypothetical protein